VVFKVKFTRVFYKTLWHRRPRLCLAVLIRLLLGGKMIIALRNEHKRLARFQQLKTLHSRGRLCHTTLHASRKLLGTRGALCH
jgi:hypothetical protein